MSSDDLTLFPLDEYEIRKLSYSELSLFLQCKFRYKAKHIDKILRQDQVSTFYLSIGRSMHLALADLFWPGPRHMYDQQHLQEVLEGRWISEGFSSVEEERWWFDKCVGMLKRLVENRQVGGEPLLVEAHFEARLDNLLLSSRVDRVDKVGQDECELIDYKVGEEKVDPNEVMRDMQWAFHYLASRETLYNVHGLSPKTITFYFLEAGESVQIKPDDELVAKAISKIKRVAQRMECERHFPPTLNKYCTDCRFDMVCPAIRELKSKGIDPAEQISRLR